jgi:hypothetical protein
VCGEEKVEDVEGARMTHGILCEISQDIGSEIFAKIEWKDTSKNPTGSKNNSLSE